MPDGEKRTLSDPAPDVQEDPNLKDLEQRLREISQKVYRALKIDPSKRVVIPPMDLKLPPPRPYTKEEIRSILGKPATKEEVEDSKSILENAWGDFKDLVLGTFELVKALPKGISMWATRPGDAWENLVDGLGLGRGPSLLGEVVDSYKQQYKDGLGAAIHRDPVHTVSDGLLLASVVGGVVKGLGRAARVAAATTLRHQGSSALRLSRLGRSIEQAGEFIKEVPKTVVTAPINRVKNVVDRSRILTLVKNSLGYTKNAEEVRGMIAENSRVRLQNVLDNLKNLETEGGKLTDEEWLRVIDAARGVAPEAELTERGRKALAMMRQLQEMYEDELDKLGLLSPDSKLRGKYGPAIAKAFNMELSDVLKLPKKEFEERVAQFRTLAAQQGLTPDPIYLPLAAEATAETRALNFLNTILNRKIGVRSARFEPTLERRTGMAEKLGFRYITEPERLVPIWLYTREAIRGLSELFDRIAARFATHMVVKRGDKWVRVKIHRNAKGEIIPGPEVIDGDGFRIDVSREAFYTPDFFRRYYVDLGKAHEAATKRFLRWSDFSEEGFDNAAKNAVSDVLNAETLEGLSRYDDPTRLRIYIIPKDVASEVTHQFMPRSVFERFGDTLMDWWRASVLAFRPAYYLANVVGDAILSVLFGTRPTAYIKALDPRYANLLPKLQYYVHNIVMENRLFNALAPRNPILRVADNLMVLAMKIDAYFRRAMFISAAEAKLWKDRMLKTGKLFFDSQEQLRAALAEQTSKLEQLPILRERIAGILKERTELEAKQTEALKALHGSLEKTYKKLKEKGLTQVELDERAIRAMAEDAVNMASHKLTLPPEQAHREVRSFIDGALGLRYSAKVEQLEDIAKARQLQQKLVAELGAIRTRMTQLQKAVNEFNAARKLLTSFRKSGKIISRAALQQKYPGLFLLQIPRGQLAGELAKILQAVDRNLDLLRGLEAPKLSVAERRSVDRLDQVLLNLRIEAEALINASKSTPQEVAAVARKARSLAARVEGTGRVLEAFGATVRGRAAVREMTLLKGRSARVEQALKQIEARIPPTEQRGALQRQTETIGKVLDLLTERSIAAAKAAEESRTRRMMTEPELARLIGSRDEARRIVDSFEQMARSVNQFLVDYLELPPLERRWLRHVIPFWGWFRQVNLLLAKLPFIRTATTIAIHRLTALALDVADDDRLPPWLRNSVPFATDDEGNVYFVSYRFLNPLANSVLTSGLAPEDVRFSMNPIIRVAIQTITGKDMFTGKPIGVETPIYGYAGQIWYVSEDGTSLRRSPETSFVSNAALSIAQQFPQVFFLDSLLHPYEKYPDSTPVFGPRPVLDADGNPRYPYPALYHLMTAMGLKPSRQTQPELRLAREERSFLKSVFRTFSRERDPAMRELYIQYAVDVARGRLRPR